MRWSLLPVAIIAAAVCTLLGVSNFTVLLALVFFVSLMVVSVRWPYAFIMIIFVIFEKLFETFDFGLPYWMYADTVVGLLLSAIGLQLLQSFRRRNHFLPNREPYFLFIVVLWVIILFTMVHGAYFVLEQSIKSLLFRARWFLLLFVFLYMYNTKFSYENVKSFYRFLLGSATIIGVLIIIDAKLLGGGKIFALAMSNGVSGDRAGAVRLSTYVTPTIWAFYYMLSLIKLKGLQGKYKWLLLTSGIILFQLLFCNMTRQLIASLVLTLTIYGFSLSSQIKMKLLPVFLTLIFAGVVTFMFTYSGSGGGQLAGIVEQTIDEATANKGGNINIRKEGIAFYFEYLKKTNYLGIGITSTTTPGSPEYEGEGQQFLMADIGLFAAFVRFGIFGLILIATLFCVMFRDVLFIMKYGDIEAKAIAGGIFYFLVGQVVLLPTSNIFFPEYETLHVGLLFYFITVLKKEAQRLRLAEENSNLVLAA